LQGSRPAGQRTRGAGSDRAKGDAIWPQITAVSRDSVGLPACMGSSHGKWKGGDRSSVLTLDSELQSQRSGHLTPTSSLMSPMSLTDSSQKLNVCCTLVPLNFLMVFHSKHAVLNQVSFTANSNVLMQKRILHRFITELLSFSGRPVNKENQPTLQVYNHTVSCFKIL